jgi:S-adenosylmethionine hydrolase
MAPGHPAPAIFFLSDYGLVDEFVGVVHAVIQRLVPGVPVIDLTHQVPSFGVVAAARVLERSVPHLGAGVVLAVVDPGVGSERRGVAVEVGIEVGPHWLVGPDNGLLLPAADLLGGPRRAVVLEGVSTFDGRDVFAPAAAHLVGGGSPEALGGPADVATLVALPDGRAEVSVTDGVVTTSVSWVDGYGNVQLAGPVHIWEEAGVVLGATVMVELGGSHGGHRARARRVSAFSSLAPDELGVVLDANGHHALALDRASAASALGGAVSGTEVRVRVVG